MSIFHESHGMDQIQQLSDYIDQSNSIVVRLIWDAPVLTRLRF